MKGPKQLMTWFSASFSSSIREVRLRDQDWPKVTQSAFVVEFKPWSSRS